ncbi:hypothetical protein Q1695_006240 [Nippostrongylus brasiliensis]|nr:hypothetical protein Q1695_006240 [Nippostrongylus brasiliensis]
MLIAAVTSLTLTERNEMSRKFKYYFNSVRPTAPENFINGSNGTFFRIFTEFHLIATHIKSNSVLVNAVLVFRWTDDRLVLRELFDDFELPKEFEPWLPRVRTSPEPHIVTVLLSPATGTLSLYHRVKDSVSCSSSEWKYPFEEMHCELSSENAGDEVVTVSSVRDLRPESQMVRIGTELGEFPECALHLKYAADWHFALLSVFLPSVLIVALVFFAQWKRRKVQVLVSLAAIMCMLILLVSSRPYHSATLLDLWICGCFVHTVFLLVVDLTLPARRVRYSLLVDVDENNSVPRQTVLKCRQSPSGARGLMKKFAEKTLGLKMKEDTAAHVVAMSNNAVPIQRQVTTTSLGERKKVALLVVATSYILFVLTYCIIVVLVT